MRRVLIFFSFLMTMLLSSASFAADDFQYWSQGYGKFTPKGDDFTLGVYGEIRMTKNATHVFGVFVGPIVNYKINPYLNTGAAWKLIMLGINGRYEAWQRVDFEINPQVTTLLDGRLSVQLRNRAELFFHPTDSDPLTETRSTTFRVRNRLTLGWSLDKAGPLEKIYVNNESFWGQYFRDGNFGYTENRATPFGLQLRISSFANLNVYYLIQSIANSSDRTWATGHCLGTFLVFQPPRPATPRAASGPTGAQRNSNWRPRAGFRRERTPRRWWSRRGGRFE